MKNMNRPSSRTFTSISTALVLGAALTVGSLAAGAPAAHAQESAPGIGVVVAQDTTPAPSTSNKTVTAALTAIPSAPGALKIHTSPRTSVTLKSQPVKSQTKSKKKPLSAATLKKVTTNKSGDAIVTGLTPGLSYTITSGSHRASATPESLVVPATSLRVITTEIAGQLELRWNHEASAAQGAVGFTVTAQSQDALIDDTSRVSAETSADSIVLTDLDLDTRYEFTVTSHNTISSGTPTKAVMAKSLSELTGTAAPVVETPAVTPIQPASTPAPANQGAPAPSGPTTRTIYVCPDGFTEEGNVCTKRTPYTYATIDYTYHSETYTVSVEKPGPAYAADIAQSTGTPCPWGGSLNAAGDLCLMPNITESETRTRQVKDTMPAGFTDTGTQWSKKDAAPAGFTDNGSEWISTTGKVARVVPA